jgi:hypothetical protein
LSSNKLSPFHTLTLLHHPLFPPPSPPPPPPPPPPLPPTGPAALLGRAHGVVARIAGTKPPHLCLSSDQFTRQGRSRGGAARGRGNAPPFFFSWFSLFFYFHFYYYYFLLLFIIFYYFLFFIIFITIFFSCFNI